MVSHEHTRCSRLGEEHRAAIIHQHPEQDTQTGKSDDRTCLELIQEKRKTIRENTIPLTI